jgi:hypothetical protein
MLQKPDRSSTTDTQARGGNALTCEVCGAELSPKPGARCQRFCGTTCRKAANRALSRPKESAVHALKNGTRYPHSGGHDQVENTSTNSIVCKADFADRGSGIRAPARVINTEAVDDRDWRESVSPDGVRCLVAYWRKGGTP